MSITLSPAKASYLERVRVELADLHDEEREEIVQDLEAHLAELDDDAIEAELGSPKMFAEEFRLSAGLESGSRRRGGRFRRWRRGLDSWVQSRLERIGIISWWSSFRPVWIWVRGWAAVAVFARLADGTPFRRFPIPTVGSRSITGLVVVAAATWVSLWLARDVGSRSRATLSWLFSAGVAVSLLMVVAAPIGPQTVYVSEDPYVYADRLVAPDGAEVENIYAYDLDGNPVEVLLFDQDGRPLRTLVPDIYEMAEQSARIAPYQDNGAVVVDFQRDDFGRIIPNLYPLQILRYDSYGRLKPVPPPSLGFPGSSTDTDLTTTGVTSAPGPGMTGQ